MVSGKDQVLRRPWGSKGTSSGRKVCTLRPEHYPSRPVETMGAWRILFSWLSIPLTFFGPHHKEQTGVGVVPGRHVFELSLCPTPQEAVLNPPFPALKMAAAGRKWEGTSLPFRTARETAIRPAGASYQHFTTIRSSETQIPGSC